MVIASVMPLVVGWGIVGLCAVTVTLGLTRADARRSMLIIVVAVAVVAGVSLVVDNPLVRVGVLAMAMVAAGAARAWLAPAQGNAAIVAIGALLVGGLVAIQLIIPSGENGAGDAFAITGMAVVGVVLWGFVALGSLVGRAVADRHPQPSVPPA